MLPVGAGAAPLAWPGGGDLTRLSGAPLIVAACIAWGIDNNLTRKVALADPLQVAMLKGLVAGSVNLALALARGATLPALPDRSEEHTSELQSLMRISYAVFCLKKKQTKSQDDTTIRHETK